ncbi:MAG: 2Fe-2S iron-sulfur cluster-binding protein [bacterium]
MPDYKVKLITPDGQEHQLLVPEGRHILDVALESGLDLPYSCLQGWCLSCSARVIQGRVNQEDSKRFYEADRREGFALLCTGKPESELVLKTHATEEMRLARKKNRLPFPKGKWGK